MLNYWANPIATDTKLVDRTIKRVLFHQFPAPSRITVIVL